MSWAATSEDRLFASSFKSVPDMWLHRCHSTPFSDAMFYRNGITWARLTWSEAEARARDIANGLLSLGVSAEQRCCILAHTSVEWILVDMGILCAGAATTTLFPSSTPEICEFILRDSESVVVFCDTMDQVAKLQQVRAQLPGVRRVVVFDGASTEDEWVITLDLLEREGQAFALGNPTAYEQAHANIEPEHLATLMYTSGTTGTPKGVMLTHDAWVYESAAVDALDLVSPADKQLLFLPLSHVFAKVLQVAFIRLGVPTAICGDSDYLIEAMQETNPTWMGTVPRIFEKVYAAIMAEAESDGPVQSGLFHWALEIGRKVSRLRQQGKEPRGLLRVRYALADRLVFSKVRERFGGELRFFVSGAAPLPTEIAEFFHAAGLLILEGYGLTESSAASCMNVPESFVFGTVGKPLPGTTVRVAEDGEILLRGRGIMAGYHNLADASEETLVHDDQGRIWLRTGDVGEVLPSGHVRITDRKKEIIITSAGKNIAPAHFRNLLKAHSRYIGHGLLHGDHRPYCVALLTMDVKTVGQWAREAGLAWRTTEELSLLPEVKALIQRDLDTVNAQLADHATVRRFALLPEDFTVDNGMLTPSLKVRRQAVEQRYSDLIEALYR